MTTHCFKIVFFVQETNIFFSEKVVSKAMFLIYRTYFAFLSERTLETEDVCLNKEAATKGCYFTKMRTTPLPNNTTNTLGIYGSVHFHHSKIAMQLDSKIVNCEIMGVNVFSFWFVVGFFLSRLYLITSPITSHSTSLLPTTKHAAHRGKGMRFIAKLMFCLANLGLMTCHSQAGYFLEKTRLSKPKTRYFGKKAKKSTFVHNGKYMCIQILHMNAPGSPAHLLITTSTLSMMIK